MKFPFEETKINENIKIRSFSVLKDTNELIWHRDREDREVFVIEANGWSLQMDNEIPVLLENSATYHIPARTFHRVIKGEGDLVVLIQEKNEAIKRRSDRYDPRNYVGRDAGRGFDASSGGEIPPLGKYRQEAQDPKVGTGKKPKGSGRRLYTDENPKDTVSVEFSSVAAIKRTLAKASFKAKSHKRQSQIINLIHQRVRAAYQNAKDPKVKARLKRAFKYAEERKEASKEKTKRLAKRKKK